MDINGSIETLEAAGFRLYRRIVNGPELISALLVYPPVDLYAEVDSLFDGTLLRFKGAAGDHTFNCTDSATLENAIQTQMQSALEKWDGAGLPPAYRDLDAWFQGPDLKTVQRLRQLKAEHGYGIECIWLTSDFGVKCLYRGAVIKVDEELMTAVGVEGKRIAIPLTIALAVLDDMGGLEEQHIKEPAELES